MACRPFLKFPASRVDCGSSERSFMPHSGPHLCIGTRWEATTSHVADLDGQTTVERHGTEVLPAQHASVVP